MRTGKIVNMTTLGLQKKNINSDKSYKYPFLSRQSIKYLGQAGAVRQKKDSGDSIELSPLSLF